MADYNPILDAETDPEAGLRSSLFKRMVANPIAIAEGAPDAPRVLPIANEVPWVAAGLLTGTNYTAFTGLNRVASIRVVAMIAGSATSTNFQISFSINNGSSWGGDQNLSTMSANQGLMLDAHINLVTGDVAAAAVVPSDGGSASSSPTPATSLTVPAGANAVRFRSANNRTGKMYLQVTGGIA